MHHFPWSKRMNYKEHLLRNSVLAVFHKPQLMVEEIMQIDSQIGMGVVEAIETM